MRARYAHFTVSGPGPDRLPDEPDYSTTRVGDELPIGPDPHRRAEFADVGRLARRGLKAAVQAARVDERPTLASLIGGHLGGATSEAEVSTQRWARHEGINMQLALDAWLSEPGRTHTSYGVPIGPDIGLAELVAGTSAYGMEDMPPVGIARVNLASGPGQMTPCASSVIHLVTEDDRRVVFFARLADPRRGMEHNMVEIVSDDPGAGELISAQLRELSALLNAFRGHVLSIGQDPFGFGEGLLQFEERPTLTRDQLILDDALLAAIERQVVGVARHREALLAGGQHLKRGVLLYGPPGVGKTHTVRYLASTLPQTTVLTISGEALALIGVACSAARSLQPALVVIEDVDLIAEDRGMHPGQHPLLFELLNEMDGLDGDADVCFLLTTNRADLLETALSARPGRVDQAIEIRLPDLDARRRLFELYVGSLDIQVTPEQLDAALLRADGVTASFLKEFARRAALFALERTGGEQDSVIRVTADDLQAALEDLLAARNALTRRLLGSATGEVFEADFDGDSDPGFE